MDLTVTVDAGDGRTASAALTLPDAARPDPPERPLAVGLSTAVENYAAWHLLFPGFAGGRVFIGPGEGLLPWDDPKVTGMPATAQPWISFKDYPTDKAFVAYLRAATRPVKLSWFHERDNNTPQSHAARMDFFARQRHLADIVVDVGQPLVEWMSPPQTLQWTAATTTTNGKVKGDGNWRLWWPGSGRGSVWDCYADSWADRYPDVQELFRIPLEAAEGTGRELYVAELGAVKMPSDVSGAGRAAFIRDCVAFLRERRAVYAAWWCEFGIGGRDFRLLDTPSADAWRAAITST